MTSQLPDLPKPKYYCIYQKDVGFFLPLHTVSVEFLNNTGEPNSQILLSTKGIAYLLRIFWNSVPSLLFSLWNIKKTALTKRQHLPMNYTHQISATLCLTPKCTNPVQHFRNKTLIWFQLMQTPKTCSLNKTFD